MAARSRTDVNAIAVGAVGAGLIFIWSGLRGASILATLQDLIRGQHPTGANVHQVDAQAPAAAAADPTAAAGAGGGKTYCASMYGGPSDHTGSRGYHGDNLVGTMSFAELGMGHALGGLPYRAQIRITYKGRSVVATKLDIGAGGAGCGGRPRAVDLWHETAAALGFNGLDVVTVEPL